MKHKIHKKISAYVLIMLAILVILALPAYSIFKNAKNLVIDSQCNNALNISIAVAKLVEQDLESYKKLVAVDSYEPGSYDEEYYLKMLGIFQDIREETGALYIYTEKIISDTEFIYILDGEDPESEFFSPLGSKENITIEELTSYLEKRPLTRGLLEYEKWGRLLSGFAPIIDPVSGEVIGLVGTDLSAEYVLAILSRIRNIIIVAFMVIILILGMATYKALGITIDSIETDYLTGLYSKRYHDRHLRWHYKRMKATNGVFSIAMLDIDNFKEINNQYGHPFGDQVLKRVSTVLKKHLRNIDICSRYGGDEFVIILSGVTKQKAASICERVLQGVSSVEMVSEKGVNVNITVSIGIVESSIDVSLEDLIARADEALYLSKNSGKNKITIYED
jgi:diguanylate cyclase (GGDEF)-like protein